MRVNTLNQLFLLSVDTLMVYCFNVSFVIALRQVTCKSFHINPLSS